MNELIKAVKDEKMHEIFKLIAAGADVIFIDEFGKTPLHYCLYAQIARVIIAAGADVTAKDAQGKTPLDYAPNAKMSEALIAMGGERTRTRELGRATDYD